MNWSDFGADFSYQMQSGTKNRRQKSTEEYATDWRQLAPTCARSVRHTVQKSPKSGVCVIGLEITIVGPTADSIRDSIQMQTADSQVPNTNLHKQ